MEQKKRKKCFRRDSRSGALPYCASACGDYEECTEGKKESEKNNVSA